MTNLILFATFLKIGFFGYGGGLGMLPLIFQSVRALGMVNEKQLADIVAVSQVTPGPIAVNAATFTGFLASGWFGAAVATLGVVIPCFILMYLAMIFTEKFKGSRIIEGIFIGIRPVTVGLIAAAIIFLAETSMVNGNIFSAGFYRNFADMFNLFPCIIAATAAVVIGKFKISPIVVILCMGAVGAFLCS